MNDFFDQIDWAIDANLYYIALLGALSTPDICGAMAAPDGWASKDRYIEWFDQYVGNKYQGSLVGENCYVLRCAFLHQGRLRHPDSPYERVIFLEPGTSSGVLHNNIINDALNIDVRTFCSDMTTGGRLWLAQVEDATTYRQNYDAFLKRHADGLAPYIGGTPVIG